MLKKYDNPSSEGGIPPQIVPGTEVAEKGRRAPVLVIPRRRLSSGHSLSTTPTADVCKFSGAQVGAWEAHFIQIRRGVPGDSMAEQAQIRFPENAALGVGQVGALRSHTNRRPAAASLSACSMGEDPFPYAFASLETSQW